MMRLESVPAVLRRPSVDRLGCGAPMAIRLSILLLLTAATACGRSKSTAGETRTDSGAAGAADAATAPSTVVFTSAQVVHGGIRWAPMMASAVATLLELPGQLVPDDDRTARLGASAQGRVVSVHVRPGESVVRGQALVTLQSPAASSAKADYDKAVAAVASRRAAASYARSARERAERLLAIKAASRQEAERAIADDELAQADLAQAQAEVARARATLAQLGVASESGAMVLRSPIGGVVLSREATPGAVAEAGTPLITVTDPRTLWLDVSAPEAVVGSLRTGARIRFAISAFPADTFEARIQSIGGALDATTRMVPIRAVVANAAGKLRPAMFATAWVETGTRQSAVVVPDAAVQLLDERQVVFVARPDGNGGARFEHRDVKVGAALNGQTQVIGGLTAGDLVVVAGAFAVKSQFARSKMAGG